MKDHASCSSSIRSTPNLACPQLPNPSPEIFFGASFHSLIFPSRPAERRNWPSLRISKRRTSPRCALSLLFTWRISLNSLVSHTLMSLSLAPDMRMSPSSSNMRLTTSPRCPSMFACSPTLMLLSSARLFRCWSDESGVVSQEGRKWGGRGGMNSARVCCRGMGTSIYQ